MSLYSPLSVQSSYSLLESPIKVTDLVTTAVQKGYQSITLTDENNMYGAIEFYETARSNQIKPIIGLKVNKIIDNQEVQLNLIAKNNVGYQSLLNISSHLMTDKINYKTINDFFADINELYVVFPPGSDSYLIESYIKLKPILNDTFIGISDKFDELDERQILLANKLNVRPIAYSSVNILNKDNSTSQSLLQSIKDNKLLDTNQTKRANFLPNIADYKALFKYDIYPQLLDNLEKLIESVNVELVFSDPKLPNMTKNEIISSEEKLNRLTNDSLKKLAPDHLTKYKARLEYELSIINKMGFADYFLIVSDVVNYSRKNDILIGPGRGSAAGSLVSFLLDITQVDPIKHNLIFERFLNPNRQSMPDIDIDVPDAKRGIVLKYLYDKFGFNHMAQILTFGTFGAKMAIRDTTKSFGLSVREQNNWTKFISHRYGNTLQQNRENSLKFDEKISESSFNENIYTLAKEIEGLPRHYSTHAAGIVLAEDPLTNSVAIQGESDGIEIVQETKKNIEKSGLLKIDFLGLRNLSIIEEILKMYEFYQGSSLDLNKLPLDDKKTLEVFQKGFTNGVFQFESEGIKKVLRKIKPNVFEDIVATNALYRPGPMENIDLFVKRKHSGKKVEFKNKEIEPILKNTYGIIVYQEQVMEVASTMGGMSLAESDQLRRAISKKDEQLISEFKTKFIEGALKKGSTHEQANQVFSYIQKFAHYGFNKSHAVAYSLIAYWLAYFKANYPLYFYVTILNSHSSAIDKYVTEIRQSGIKVNYPDINFAKAIFSIVDGEIYFGFNSIKGLRKDFVKNIINEREQKNFTNLDEFIGRISPKFRTISDITPLIFSGALDQFEPNRKQLQENIQRIIDSYENGALFNELQVKHRKVKPLSLHEKIDSEREILGTFLTSHPAEKYSSLHIKNKTLFSNQLHEVDENSSVKVVGYITSVKEILTKEGKQMAFAKVEDQFGSFELVMFPDVYTKLKNMPLMFNTFIISGRIQQRETIQLIVNEISNPEDFSDKSKEVFINVVDEDKVKEVMSIWDQQAIGETSLILVYHNEGQKKAKRFTKKIKRNEKIFTKIKNIVGENNYFEK